MEDDLPILLLNSATIAPRLLNFPMVLAVCERALFSSSSFDIVTDSLIGFWSTV